MKIESEAFANNGNIPKTYTCDGVNINPPLLISNVPEKAKSLAIIVDDPDAPNGTWNHFIIWNIDPKIQKIEEGKLKAGTIGGNSRGHLGYDGPCPPDGEHHYVFKLYALDKILDLPSGANKKELILSMDGHILEEAELIGKYNRT